MRSTWYADLAMLLAARGLLAACPPARAHAVLLRIGARFPPIETADEARRTLRFLARYGTCLTRSLAVAARIPRADVVIGVAPRKDAPLFAHAWVEMDGMAVDPADVAGAIIARLHGPQSPTRRA
jgi:hypothetical protein